MLRFFHPALHPLSNVVLGGDDGIRTHDPLLAGQVLSQLSYTPIGVCMFFAFQRSEEFDNPSKLNNKRRVLIESRRPWL